MAFLRRRTMFGSLGRLRGTSMHECARRTQDWLFFSVIRHTRQRRPSPMISSTSARSSVARRACEREVALNRRLAPKSYLGVAHFTGPRRWHARTSYRHASVRRRHSSGFDGQERSTSSRSAASDCRDSGTVSHQRHSWTVDRGSGDGRCDLCPLGGEHRGAAAPSRHCDLSCGRLRGGASCRPVRFGSWCAVRTAPRRPSHR